MGMWVREKEASCYICNRYKDTYERYLDTFFVMYQRDEEFRKKISSGKGFCLSHFGDLCEAAEKKLSEKEKAEFFPMIFQVMEENMNRLFEDVYGWWRNSITGIRMRTGRTPKMRSREGCRN